MNPLFASPWSATMPPILAYSKLDHKLNYSLVLRNGRTDKTLLTDSGAVMCLPYTLTRSCITSEADSGGQSKGGNAVAVLSLILQSVLKLRGGCTDEGITNKRG